jgi:hypothetical protein
MEKLADYLETFGRRRWHWGETDCLMMLADWIKLRHGVDPAADIRGTYSTEEESLELMVRHRGIVGCIEHCVRPLGIDRTSLPVKGDIGVVFAGVKRRGKIRHGLTGAICVSDRLWAVKSPAGLMIADFRFLRTWSVSKKLGCDPAGPGASPWQARSVIRRRGGLGQAGAKSPILPNQRARFIPLTLR